VSVRAIKTRKGERGKGKARGKKKERKRKALKSTVLPQKAMNPLCLDSFVFTMEIE
jgi:hypothetical protein